MEEDTFENTPSDEQQSWLVKIVVLPKYLGEFIFDLLGRREVKESYKFIIGYLLLLGVFLLGMGFIAPELLSAILKALFQKW